MQAILDEMKNLYWINVLISAAMMLLMWELLARVLSVPEYLTPRPSQILLLVYIDYGYFCFNGIITLVEAVSGLLIAFFLSFMLACCFGLFTKVEKLVLPYAIAAQATPIVAIAPLLILWLGSGLASKVAMAAIICFFPMLITISRGLRATLDEQQRLFVVYGASRWQVLRKLRIPTSVPYVFAGLRVSAALSMIGAIVAEYAGANNGLGYVIMQSTYRVDTARLFGGVLFSIIGSLLLFSVIVWLERHIRRAGHYTASEE